MDENLTQPGDLFEHKGVTYEVLDRKQWYCNFLPVGVITDGPNVGIKVPLVNSQYKWVSVYA